MHLNVSKFKYIISLGIGISLTFGSAKINNKCTSRNGVCISIKDCEDVGGTTFDGLCTNESSSVKCCIKKKCYIDGNEGSCMFSSKCKGISYDGACPGESNYQCCITNKNSNLNDENNQLFRKETKNRIYVSEKLNINDRNKRYSILNQIEYTPTYHISTITKSKNHNSTSKSRTSKHHTKTSKTRTSKHHTKTSKTKTSKYHTKTSKTKTSKYHTKTSKTKTTKHYTHFSKIFNYYTSKTYSQNLKTKYSKYNTRTSKKYSYTKNTKIYTSTNTFNNIQETSIYNDSQNTNQFTTIFNDNNSTPSSNSNTDDSSMSNFITQMESEQNRNMFKTTIYGCPKSSNHTSTNSGSTKIHEAISEILKNQVECQNSPLDMSNYFDGEVGYTCLGVSPSLGYINRETYFSYALESCLYGKAHFVKCAYNLNKINFINAVENLYNEQYATHGGCSDLPQPAFYVCLDLAIHHSPSWAADVIKNNPIGDMNGKEYGHLINELSRQMYYQMNQQSNYDDRITEWITIVDGREEYINNYC